MPGPAGELRGTDASLRRPPSAAATCRQQRRSLFTYLSELIIAHTRGDPFPALAA